jgi:quercetin dioxygenase-like cupin family protein
MRTRLAALAFAAAAGVAAHAAAHGPAGHEEELKLLQQQRLPDLVGKQAIMLTVHYKPGTKSSAHTHPGPVFAYVLDGAVESQLNGEAPVVYRAGQSWYEGPGARHMISRNASKTAPATLLVWMIKGDTEAPVLPLPAD